ARAQFLAIPSRVALSSSSQGSHRHSARSSTPSAAATSSISCPERSAPRARRCCSGVSSSLWGLLVLPTALALPSGLPPELVAVERLGDRVVGEVPGRGLVGLLGGGDDEGGRTFTILFPRLLRPLDEGQRKKLEGSIRRRGVLALVVDEHDGVIDGVYRLRIAAELKLPGLPVQVRRGLAPDEKREFRFRSRSGSPRPRQAAPRRGVPSLRGTRRAAPGPACQGRPGRLPR